jgi:hypothetical protein
MKTFAYEITHHPANAFKELVCFCTEAGECTLDEVPRDQTKTLAGILNEHGQKGWELVQVCFGQEGIMAFWKRKVKEKEE